ncbi:hypothetical protein N2W37_003058 [Clostridium perfringens]|uniref:hypothetical protein n=1 Tax=Clostridium perfringens TaxID=1502 RepID=UPI001159FD0A|nr:hypothetical protein [Clostridium perfringens]EHA6442218.1 hypothetical protein [Clostridium perfringens]EJT5923913.1 hypothetical protein [Clostridium perfringens]MDM0627700.1 hypothetical protein [Clostridium perfringens]
MDILYYFNHTEDQIQALNLDNIKHMECKVINKNELNYSAEFYIDEFLVHSYERKELLKIIKEIASSEKNLLKAYNYYSYNFATEYEKELIRNNDFSYLQEYMKKRKIKNYVYNLEFSIVKIYCEILKTNRWFCNSEEINYQIVVWEIFKCYFTHCKYSKQYVNKN